MTDVGRLRGLVSGQDTRDVNELLGKVVDGFKRAGYSLIIRNEAWLKPGGIAASTYVNSPDGKRFRGALLIQLTRGEARAQVYLTNTEPPMFQVKHGLGKPETLAQIDRTILAQLRTKVDTQTEQAIGHTIRILL
jgi:hypothetical protein